MTYSDVVVLGAGPAGTATAITCAKAGLRALLIERHAFPRHAPGETLHPGVLPLLQTLGVHDDVMATGFLRHEGHFVQWHGPRRFVAFGADAQGPWRGLQAWRPSFDAILLEHARRLGVSVEQPVSPRHAIQVAGKVVGVVTERGCVSADFVVDATGRQHWLTRQLGLNTHYASPLLLAWYGYACGDCPERDEAPLLVADQSGWTWLARVQPHFFQWTRLSFNGRRLDDDWLPEEFAKLDPCPPRRGADVTWRMGAAAAGPGYFLVGDAAAVLDPASSHGVLKALMSGMLAGHLIAQVKLHGLPPSVAAKSYVAWLHDWFCHDVDALRKFYSVAENGNGIALA